MKKQLKPILLLIALLCCSLCVPGAASAASGDPALRFELSTQDAAGSLRAGDQVRVEVSAEREDGSTEPYKLASVMLDIAYDNELFEVSQPKSCGLKRPDGEAWIGSWTCNTISLAEGMQVRILYLNMSGLMSEPPRLDQVSGKFEAASFVLTAKKDVVNAKSEVKFSFVENGDVKGNESPSAAGDPLVLQFAAGAEGGGADQSGGTGTGGSGGSGSGSGSGTGGSGSGQGSSAGQNGQGNTPGQAAAGESGESSAGGAKIAFNQLTDVPSDHWAAAYIEALVTKGILSGNEEKQFQPDKPVTRAEFCQMIAASFGYEAKSETEAVFGDVRASDWYYKPVMALYESGVAAGLGNGRFGADETLSRQDMAVILERVKRDQNLIRPLQREYAAFPDQNKVEDYAKQALMELYCTGLISGTDGGRLAPLEDSTRAQAATVLYKMLEEGERR